MDQQPFDMASMQSMAFAASGNFGKGAAGTTSGNASLAGGIGGSGGGKGRGVRFWAAVEGVTKTALLLLAGAGVGGLLFPEASAAGAQTKYGEEFFVGGRWGGVGMGMGRGGVEGGRGGRELLFAEASAMGARTKIGELGGCDRGAAVFGGQRGGVSDEFRRYILRGGGWGRGGKR